MGFKRTTSVLVAMAAISASTLVSAGAGGFAAQPSGRTAKASASKRPAHPRKRRRRRRKVVHRPPSTPPDSVLIQGYAFHPATLTVKPGTAVTWLFRDNGIAHWVVSDSEGISLQSSPQTSGSYSFDFVQPGTYDYSCALHTWMKGEIGVAAGAS